SLQRLIPPAFITRFKARFDGPMMLCGALDGDSARQLLRKKEIDLVAFGLPFVANPDLPERLRNHWPLAEPDTTTLYTGEEQGYVDYPPYR
ncbi:MAG: alkene reductase, partial [Burkholderiaceae bacterium]|nr:alkene reductase [Burkholderiaceae bacterium]